MCPPPLSPFLFFFKPRPSSDVLALAEGLASDCGGLAWRADWCDEFLAVSNDPGPADDIRAAGAAAAAAASCGVTLEEKDAPFRWSGAPWECWFVCEYAFLTLFRDPVCQFPK